MRARYASQHREHARHEAQAASSPSTLLAMLLLCPDLPVVLFDACPRFGCGTHKGGRDLAELLVIVQNTKHLEACICLVAAVRWR